MFRVLERHSDVIVKTIAGGLLLLALFAFGVLLQARVRETRAVTRNECQEGCIEYLSTLDLGCEVVFDENERQMDTDCMTNLVDRVNQCTNTCINFE